MDSLTDLAVYITFIIGIVCLVFVFIVAFRKDQKDEDTSNVPFPKMRNAKPPIIIPVQNDPIEVSDEEAALIEDEMTLIEEMIRSSTSYERKKEILATLEATGAYKIAVERILQQEEKRNTDRKRILKEITDKKKADDDLEKKEEDERKVKEEEEKMRKSEEDEKIRKEEQLRNEIRKEIEEENRKRAELEKRIRMEILEEEKSRQRNVDVRRRRNEEMERTIDVEERRTEEEELATDSQSGGGSQRDRYAEEKRNDEVAAGHLFDLGECDFAIDYQGGLGVDDTNSTHYDKKKHSKKDRIYCGDDARDYSERTDKGRGLDAEFVRHNIEVNSGSATKRAFDNRRHGRGRNGHSNRRKVH